MAALRYRDEHNKVGYLQKPTGSDDYHQILDFLRASHIRSPGGASSSHIPTNVPTGVVPASVSNKGKTPMVEEDITVKERTLKQMEDDRLGEEAAKRLHDEEQAQVDRQRVELNIRRQQEVLAC
ncbi:hypothetical protein Tco_0505789 [Tanacetum coccineum]